MDIHANSDQVKKTTNSSKNNTVQETEGNSEK